MTRRTPDGRPLRARLVMRFGRRVEIKVAAGSTPAALLGIGALVSSILLSTAVLVWAARRQP